MVLDGLKDYYVAKQRISHNSTQRLIVRPVEHIFFNRMCVGHFFIVMYIQEIVKMLQTIPFNGINVLLFECK